MEIPGIRGRRAASIGLSLALIALPILTAGQFGILFAVMRPLINALARLFAGIDTDVFG